MGVGAQFLTHTLQILEINLSFEAVKMISLYLIQTSFPFFLYQKLQEILIWYIRIISKASKDRLISKIWRVWLINWARHAHLNFEV